MALGKEEFSSNKNVRCYSGSPKLDRGRPLLLVEVLVPAVLRIKTRPIDSCGR